MVERLKNVKTAHAAWTNMGASLCNVYVSCRLSWPGLHLWGCFLGGRSHRSHKAEPLRLQPRSFKQHLSGKSVPSEPSAQENPKIVEPLAACVGLAISLRWERTHLLSRFMMWIQWCSIAGVPIWNTKTYQKYRRQHVPLVWHDGMNPIGDDRRPGPSQFDWCFAIYVIWPCWNYRAYWCLLWKYLVHPFARLSHQKKRR